MPCFKHLTTFIFFKPQSTFQKDFLLVHIIKKNWKKLNLCVRKIPRALKFSNATYYQWMFCYIPCLEIPVYKGFYNTQEWFFLVLPIFYISNNLIFFLFPVIKIHFRWNVFSGTRLFWRMISLPGRWLHWTIIIWKMYA